MLSPDRTRATMYFICHLKKRSGVKWRCCGVKKRMSPDQRTHDIFLYRFRTLFPLTFTRGGVRFTLFKPDQTLLNSSAITYLYPSSDCSDMVLSVSSPATSPNPKYRTLLRKEDYGTALRKYCILIFQGQEERLILKKFS